MGSRGAGEERRGGEGGGSRRVGPDAADAQKKLLELFLHSLDKLSRNFKLLPVGVRQLQEVRGGHLPV